VDSPWLFFFRPGRWEVAPGRKIIAPGKIGAFRARFVVAPVDSCLLTPARLNTFIFFAEIWLFSASISENGVYSVKTDKQLKAI